MQRLTEGLETKKPKDRDKAKEKEPATESLKDQEISLTETPLNDERYGFLVTDNAMANVVISFIFLQPSNEFFTDYL